MDLIESWFEGRPIKLEKIYTASEDGFTGTAYQSKCSNIENIINIAESEHGNKFGGYSSVKIDESHKSKWYADPQSFVFSLSQ